MWTWKHGHTELNSINCEIASQYLCVYMYFKSRFFQSCFRSSENDSKLERNIEFIAEVLARHIFNLTTKVSPPCLTWMNFDYCFVVINLGCHIHLQVSKFLSPWIALSLETWYLIWAERRKEINCFVKATLVQICSLAWKRTLQQSNLWNFLEGLN